VIIERFAIRSWWVQHDNGGWATLGARMGVLILKCPITGKMFSTGIQADAETVKSLPQVQTRSRCPHCRADHLWWPQDAVFSPALAPSAWVENQRWPPDDTA
jgi:hypothetical protein